MKRAGALLGVVVMVAAAFLVRSVVTGDDSAGGDGRNSSSGPAVVCAADLAEFCTDLPPIPGVRTEAAGATADALVAATDADALDADAWIVTAAWADLVIAERSRLGVEPLFEVSGPPLASSPIVLAIWADRDAELAERCTTVDWRCLAEQEGSALATNDRVRPAGPEIDTAAGLTVAAAQMAQLVGTTDFASNDFVGDIPSLADRLAAGQTASPLRTMRSRGPGQVTAAGVLAHDARTLTSNFGSITLRVDPAVRADVVVVVPIGRSVSGDVRTALEEKLIGSGWDPPPADGAPDGLPDGSVLAAVRTLWNDAR